MGVSPYFTGERIAHPTEGYSPIGGASTVGESDYIVIT